MKYYRKISISLLLLFLFFEAVAQLSPGDLSKAHADLEGVMNCTQCHVLGQKVSNDKCLNCHTEIKTRMDLNTGYHSSGEVRGKDCATCHSDHHGRNFDMINFDEDNFDHDLTKYELTGAHQQIDCRECHKPDFVADRSLNNLESTFLGLEHDCISCHEDYHQETLSNDCAQCHDTEAFAPAPGFDHDDTDFALIGGHESVECIDCHQMEVRNGRDFQEFAGVEFANCNSCHEDVHQNNLGSDCKQCHTEVSFTASSGFRRFDHNQTNFPLKGKHQQVNCADCHDWNLPMPEMLQDRFGIETDNCIACHEDVHDNKFGPRCVECHNEESFHIAESGAPLDFNHALTGFELAGKHQEVDCRECHTTSFMDPLPHNACADCHDDFHEGQFEEYGFSPDCAKCHTVDGFDISLFTIADHSETDFPLDGAHIATPCFSCHLQDEEWQFRNIGERCVDCHEDVHDGTISEEYYPNQDCERCHLTTSWRDSRFDHNLTAFALSGGHAEQECRACHVPDEEFKYGRFASLSSTCTECHEDTHHRQFEENGGTDCLKCHGYENWEASKFDHDDSQFPLTGQHVEVECAACHQEIEVDNEVFVQYKFESFECVVCHQ